MEVSTLLNKRLLVISSITALVLSMISGIAGRVPMATVVAQTILGVIFFDLFCLIVYALLQRVFPELFTEGQEVAEPDNDAIQTLQNESGVDIILSGDGLKNTEGNKEYSDDSDTNGMSAIDMLREEDELSSSGDNPDMDEDDSPLTMNIDDNNDVIIDGKDTGETHGAESSVLKPETTISGSELSEKITEDHSPEVMARAVRSALKKDED